MAQPLKYSSIGSRYWALQARKSIDAGWLNACFRGLFRIQSLASLLFRNTQTYLNFQLCDNQSDRNKLDRMCQRGKGRNNNINNKSPEDA